jgi:hypothetical protein
MTQPTTTLPATPSATGTPATPPATHPCVRCGAPVALDVGLCERCNPLGLSDPASSQAHGTVFVGIAAFVVVLAVAGRLALSGIGPFQGSVLSVQAQPDGLAVTVQVRNAGEGDGASVCRLSDPANAGAGPSAIIRSPRIAAGETQTFSATVAGLGTNPRALAIVCDAP